MDKIELARRMLLENNLPTKSVEGIERGVRAVLKDGSFLDIMDSGVVLIYAFRRIPCDEVMQYRERIRNSLLQLRALDAIAGIEVFSDSCYLAVLRKLNFKLSIDKVDDSQYRRVWREYISTIKIFSILSHQVARGP